MDVIVRCPVIQVERWLVGWLAGWLTSPVEFGESAAKKNKGEIYFVLPTEKGNLMIMNRPLFEAFKKTKLVDKDMKSRDLFRDCVYHTNCKSERGKRSRKRKFLRWKGLI